MNVARTAIGLCDCPVSVRFPVQWGELDALGHVNNARYFTWFESARIALFERVGLATTGTPAVGPILAHASCDFLVPVRYPAEIVVGARISRLGTTSFGMDYVAAVAVDENRPVARGVGVIVLIDYSSGSKVAIPSQLRAALAELG